MGNLTHVNRMKEGNMVISKRIRLILDRMIMKKEGMKIYIHDLYREEFYCHPMQRQIDNLPECFTYKKHIFTRVRYGAGLDCVRRYLEIHEQIGIK
mgnify:CR=1 FL=1